MMFDLLLKSCQAEGLPAVLFLQQPRVLERDLHVNPFEIAVSKRKDVFFLG
jgi:hypothetical protein